MDRDPKRTVRARLIPELPNPADEAARFYGEPGDMIRVNRHNARDLLWGFEVARPGCGQFLSLPLFPAEGCRGTVTGGTPDDVATLSLSPSILNHCCGWHGHLRGGVFESC